MFNHAPRPNRLACLLLVSSILLSLLLTVRLWSVVQWQASTITMAPTCEPDWQELVFSQKTNTFDVSLMVQVVEDGHSGSVSADRWIFCRRIQRRPVRRKTCTFADLADIADDDWRLPIRHSVHLLYPQALDMKQVVADITSCRPIIEAPTFNQTIRFFNVSSTVCVPNEAVKRSLDAIVVIKSAVYNFADRERIRRAYAKEAEREPTLRMAMVFSVGLPRSSGGRFFQRDGINISLPGRAGASLEKMQSRRPEVLRKLSEESELNGDLVLGDFEDTYYNLSLKLFHTFQWASRFCRGHFMHNQRPPVFVIMDDDYAFNASRLKTELDALSDAQIRRVILGSPMRRSNVYRPFVSSGFEKWTVSKRQVPWPYFAPYGSGAFLVLGADVLQEIALAMYFTVQFSVDDAWLGMVMTKLDLNVQHHPHMYIGRPKVNEKELVLFAPFDYLFGEH